MKKVIFVLLALVLSVGLLACDNAPVHGGEKSNFSSNDHTLSSTSNSQGNTDGSQDDDTKVEPVKWSEDDYYIEDNWKKTTLVYKQWAERFENIDTSSDGFRIYPNVGDSTDESDRITVIYGPSAYDIRLTSQDFLREELEAINVGSTWQEVFNVDPNIDCYIWLSASYDRFPQYSFHYAKHWIYYIEYEDLTVTKIVKILPEGVTETGDGY